MKRAAVAAGASLAVHAGVLLALGSSPPAPGPAAAKEEPLQVEVLRLAGVISPAKQAARSSGEPAPRKPKAQAPRSKTAEPSGEKSVEPEPAAALAEAEASGGEATAQPPPAAQDGPAVAAGPAPLDTSALSQRLQQVALRCYPPAARRFRQTGEAQVRFCLDGAGGLRESKVTRSSGSDLLDGAAADCVVPGAAPFGPEAVGRCFELPVRFRL